jgi:prepilin-type N-terminal cleavage/methylation domain-containing protein
MCEARNRRGLSQSPRRGLFRPPRSGFTLIELLVVIAIIALLVSILMPSLKESRKLAIIASCSVNQRNTLLLMSMYASDYNSYPDTRCHRLWNPTNTGEFGSSHNGGIMRGYSVMYAQQIDPQHYATNRAFMCPSTDLKTRYVSNVGPWDWRFGSNPVAVRDPESEWGWSVSQQPYYKVLTTGMALGHHGTAEPWGHLAFWFKGLHRFNQGDNQKFILKVQTSTVVVDALPAMPPWSVPMVACPTWQKAEAGRTDFPTQFTPHGLTPVNWSFGSGNPLERNIGFSDGHVRYFKKQTADSQQ